MYWPALGWIAVCAIICCAPSAHMIGACDGGRQRDIEGGSVGALGARGRGGAKEKCHNE
jgi:hypothetical protein